MAYDLDEQEQLDNFKAFWVKWGKTIVTLITVLALASAAYYAYQAYQRSAAEKAAPLFEQLEKTANTLTQDFDAEIKAKGEANADPKAVSKIDPKNIQLVNDLAKKLTQEHAGTAYAQLGATLAAKVQAELGKTAEAEHLWQWLVNSAKDPEYSYLARLHLAAVPPKLFACISCLQPNPECESPRSKRLP